MSNAIYSTYEIRANAVKSILNNNHVSLIAKAYNVHRATVYRWLQKYKKKRDFNDLVRKPVSGRPRKLTAIKQLKKIILKPASKYGYETDFWTCKRLMQIIEEKFNLKISKPTIWRNLQNLNFTYQKPERRYFEADEKKRQEWLRNELPKIMGTTRKYRAILYFEDESNISLTAVVGKTWAVKGETPIQKVTGKRASISAMSAISKSGNLLFTLHDKKITSKEIIQFFSQMLKHHKRRHLVVVIDQARPHVSKMVKKYISEQKRLHVFYLPPYSPDFNPDEKVWFYLKNEGLKSHKAKTKIEMKALVYKKLYNMSKNSKLICSLFFLCSVAKLMK